MRELGDQLEDRAANYLERRGLALVARQVRYRMGEIDLVMKDGETVVFVEVRYRRNIHFGDGASSVDHKKRKRLRTAAQLYLMEHPDAARVPCRFDVISACGRADKPQWDWYRNAFH